MTKVSNAAFVLWFGWLLYFLQHLGSKPAAFFWTLEGAVVEWTPEPGSNSCTLLCISIQLHRTNRLSLVIIRVIHYLVLWWEAQNNYIANDARKLNESAEASQVSLVTTCTLLLYYIYNYPPTSHTSDQRLHLLHLQCMHASVLIHHFLLWSLNLL